MAGDLFRWFNKKEGETLLRSQVMINRNSWGHLYSMARGEILGFMEDKLMRKHLSRMFSLIKNES